jgi:hypothetical protein
MAHRGDGLNDIFEHNVTIREKCSAENFVGEMGTFGVSTTFTTATPTNPTATQTASGSYSDDGNYFSFKVYALKDGVYSQALPITFSDSGTSSVTYNILLDWDAVDGASGYKIVVMEDNLNGYYGDAYIDVATNSLEYDGNVTYWVGDYVEIIPTPQSPYISFIGEIETGDAKLWGDLEVLGLATIGGTLNVGGKITGNRIETSFDNAGYSNDKADAGLIINNTNDVGQNLVSSYIGDVLVAKWRTDYVGNISWCSGATDYDRGHYFFVNGDYPDAYWRMTLFNSGVRFYYGQAGSETKIAMDIPETTGNILAGASEDVGTKLNVKDSVSVYNGTTLGTEKLTNGTFTGSATGWTLGAGWAYNTNLVRKESNGTATLSQTSAGMVTPLIVGEIYKLTYTISTRTAGSVTASCGGVTFAARSSNATFTETFKATSTADLVFTPTNTARFYIDTISLKRISDGNLFVGGNINANSVTIKNGFTGTGAYTNFTIVNGIITAAT